jgi:uncharacterized membrane protein
MEAKTGLMDLMAAALQRFADGWKSWGLLALALGAVLFAFTMALVVVAAGVGLLAGVADADPRQDLPVALMAAMGAGGFGVLMVWTVGWQLVFAGVIRLSLRELDHGTPVRLADLPSATLTDVVPVLAVTLFTLVIGIVGACLCVLPGVLAGAVLVWALPLVVDQGMDPLAALRESARRFAERPWWTLGFSLVGTLSMVILGQVLPVVGPGVGQVLYALFLVRGYRQLYPAS